ncbi:MAG TPA: glycosyltransferase [Vicinamibacterales bacterium]|nr:glycosyltransferase [Vicinamibacterales bacterium]
MGGILNKIAPTLLALLIALTPQASGPDASSQASEPAPTARVPELPRLSVSVGDLPPASRTLTVRRGDNLQAAIDNARGGDVITLEPGAEFEGPFRLPKRSGDGWVVIRPALDDAALPARGERISPMRATGLPRLISRSDVVVKADPGAHHYRLIGLEIAPAAGVALRSIVDLGGDAIDLASVPYDIVIERCYLRGDPKRGTRRGIALNSRQTAIIDSYFADFKEVGADSQAIAGWNGPGPYLIANNYLEAAGENVMFGGADPKIDELVPSDITIVNNTLAKPLRWRASDARFEGTEWSVKNLFELKNARRVLIEHNIFEYNWPHAQNGFAILFTPRNQDGDAPWSVVEDITFRSNVVRHVGAGINLLGHDDIHSSRQTSRIAIVNNVFADVGGSWGSGRLFQLLDGTRDVVIDHNTAFQTGGSLSGGDRRPHTGFVFQNNIVMAGPTGISGSRMGYGAQAVKHYFPDAIIRRNIVVGGDEATYPGDNLFPATLADVGVVPDRHGLPFASLAARYAGKATDGTDPGARVTLAEPTLPAAEVPEAAATNDGGTMRLIAQLLFWLSFATLGYIFIGYPLLARLRAAINPKTRRRAPIEPAVTIIVAAHNEEQRIERRLRNLLALDYPPDKLRIVVASDGSTDGTVARARAFESEGVVVHDFEERRGKPAMFNALVPRAWGEIVVFADARQRFDQMALRALVANFADPGVGAVSGELVMTAASDASTGGEGAAMYWQYEKLIRSTESRGGSTVGATGAIYAIRKPLFERLPEDTILDDVLLPVRIVRRGYQVVFEPAAKAFDVAPANGHAELVRKVRTIGGTFQLFSRERWLLDPRLNPLWFETISHKGLRLTIPVWLGLMLASNLMLLQLPFYQLMIGGQAAFYAAALAGFGQQHARRRRMILTLPYTMCLLSWATIVGFIRFVTKTQEVTWEITSRKVRSQS